MKGGEMTSAAQHFDAVVIGAGFSGMHMLKSLRDKLGLQVRVYEAGETVGGTWYWNRYPGARCDSDAYIYCFTWDKQLLQDWEWSERYPEQLEILRYLEQVAKRHDLKRDMQFDTRVTGAEFDETTNLWRVRTDKGEEVTARSDCGQGDSCFRMMLWRCSSGSGSTSGRSPPRSSRSPILRWPSATTPTAATSKPMS